MSFRKARKGAAFLMSMIVLAIISAWAVSIYSISGANVQLAENQRKADCARACAESGLEITRFWLNRFSASGTTAPSLVLGELATSLQDDLAASDIHNITLYYDGSRITISEVALDSAQGKSFSAEITQIDANTVQLDVIGAYDSLTRKISVNYHISELRHPIFDFGLATKGPLHLDGNPTLIGATFGDEADIYIESVNHNVALYVAGNTNFGGDVSIANPTAEVDFRGDILIGDDEGQAAVDNHVFIGADPVDFPVPDTDYFRQYATGTTIDGSTDTTDNMTLTNVTIQAGANSCFEGNVVVNGVLFIEMPNQITFNGNIEINGLIVADGDVNNPGSNNITFLGNFHSGSLPSGAEFDHMRQETGSSLLAPGFSVNMSGNFATLGGVMAVSGAYFSGNVDAVVKGSIISYSEDSTVVIEGNPTLVFDRAGTTKTPGGFDPIRELEYDPASYSEVFL